MFTDKYDTLQSLTYSFKKENGTLIDVRIHDCEAYVIDDMLAKLLDLPMDLFYGLVAQCMENNQIIINKHLRYHAWYGSSNGKIYNLIGKNILGFKKIQRVHKKTIS